MSFLSDFILHKEIDRIRKGETGQLSIASIATYIIDLDRAKRNLSPSEYNQVYDSLLQIKKQSKTSIKQTVDYQKFFLTCADIIREFDEIAPFEKYLNLGIDEASNFKNYLTGIRASKDVQRIRFGGTAQLSIASITDLIISTQDAKKNLPPEQFARVWNEYLKMRECTSEMTLDIQGYYDTCADILKRFDAIAPCEHYLGLSPFEASLVMEEVRSRKRN